jgi:diguanylate cyclase (GGDEF)-like protein
MAERLREAVAAVRPEVAGKRLPVSISVGVTMLEQADEPLSQLLQRADQAMYRAKQGGRNRVEAHRPLLAWPPAQAWAGG